MTVPNKVDGTGSQVRPMAAIRTAIRTARPWGVDVSSGIESVPGIKNPDRMRQFLEEARRADALVNV